METDVAVLAERRAKMAKLRSEHFVAGRDVTSAPHITSVDEYADTFGAAEHKMYKDLDDFGAMGQDEHKIFYANGPKLIRAENKKSDLSFNPLIDEANNRRKNKSDATETTKNIHSSNTITDDFSDESLDNYIDQGFAKEIQNNVVEKEKSSKFYSDGEYLATNEDQGYLGTNEDQGYQSAANSPSESQRRSTTTSAGSGDDDKGVVLKTSQLLKIEQAMDPLSASLPESFLKSVKTDLSQSIKSTTSNKSRFVVWFCIIANF